MCEMSVCFWCVRERERWKKKRNERGGLFAFEGDKQTAEILDVDQGKLWL